MCLLRSPLKRLPREIYSIIVTHIPLHRRPSTLRSLALADRTLYAIVIHHLYACLILKSDTDSQPVLQRLLSHPDLGKRVRELHIHSDTWEDTSSRPRSYNVIIALQTVVAAGHLPLLHTLSLHLDNSWFASEYQLRGFQDLGQDLWTVCQQKSPRLQSISVLGLSNESDEPWLDNSILVSDLNFPKSKLSLEFGGFAEEHITEHGFSTLVKKLEHVSDTLDTLCLRYCASSITSNGLLELSFRKLRAISLSAFQLENTAQAMKFWGRHPTLECVDVIVTDPSVPWFSRPPSSGLQLLPQLKHLKANFNAVLILAPLLNQLTSLTTYGSLNGQVPYLLRSVLANGLPNLKSLRIDQRCSFLTYEDVPEGATWYETLDGFFCEKRPNRAVQWTWHPRYMRAITRGAPNLEELGFLEDQSMGGFACIAQEIARFPKLQRFYTDSSINNENELLKHALKIGKACKSLDMIVVTCESRLPYPKVMIRRSGDDVSVEMGNGYGMEIGNEEEALSI